MQQLAQSGHEKAVNVVRREVGAQGSERRPASGINSIRSGSDQPEDNDSTKEKARSQVCTADA